MVCELVLTIMLSGEPREIDWKTVETEASCKQDAAELNGNEGFYSYQGAKAFCREIPRWRAHPSPWRYVDQNVPRPLNSEPH
ncbi:hypothetical protein [Bradyrhizobium sp. 23AC]